MDNQTRSRLLIQLSEAQQRRSATQRELESHAASLSEVRKKLGNPFFYASVPSDHPQSQSHFTGYGSHEPGLRLIRQWQDAAKEIETIQKQLSEG